MCGGVISSNEKGPRMLMSPEGSASEGEVTTGENLVTEGGAGRIAGQHMLNRKRATSEAGRNNGTKSNPDQFSNTVPVNLTCIYKITHTLRDQKESPKRYQWFSLGVGLRMFFFYF